MSHENSAKFLCRATDVFFRFSYLYHEAENDKMSRYLWNIWYFCIKNLWKFHFILCGNVHCLYSSSTLQITCNRNWVFLAPTEESVHIYFLWPITALHNFLYIVYLCNILSFTISHFMLLSSIYLHKC